MTKSNLESSRCPAPWILTLLLIVLPGCGPKVNKDGSPRPPRGYPNMTLLKAAYVAGQLEAVDLKPEVPESIIVHKDLVYKQTAERDLKLDIYLPRDLPGPVPLLIFIHGGAWKQGDKSDYLVYLLAFAKRGYVTATVAYRFSQEALFPAAVQDVKCAVRWLRKHASEYGFDPNKIAAIGGSAGGHLSMMIGYSSDAPELDGPCDAESTSSRVQAVVNLYGPTDLTTDFAISQPVVPAFLGATYDEAPDAYRAASPITYLTADDPPTLIFQGTLDDTVPVGQSDTLNARLEALGIPHEYHRLEGWPHTMDVALPVNEYCQYYMDAFFRKYLMEQGQGS